jgi:hypothetical protein
MSRGSRGAGWRRASNGWPWSSSPRTWAHGIGTSPPTRCASTRAARRASAVDVSVRDRTAYRLEYRTAWSDGGIHWVQAIGRAYYDAGTGQPMRMAGTVANIDERKTQEERSEHVVQVAGLGLWYSDLAAGRQRHLPRAARPSAQGVMTRDRVRERIHPEDVARMDEATRRSSSTASPSTSPPSTSSRSPCARRCRRRTSHPRRGSW